MLSKNKIKFIQSLEKKKTRDEYHSFLAEGNKLVTEALSSEFSIELLVATSDFLIANSQHLSRVTEVIETGKDLIRKASLQQSPQDALAVIKKPSSENSVTNCNQQLSIALDCLQDPGNMGTILRIADWFGVKQIICSLDTVDVYNPKVVQASMGAIFRVKTFYTNLSDFLLQEKQNGTPVYGTFMNGENIYQQTLSSNGILVMGNEGNGISENIEQLVSHHLSIPSFAEKNAGSESLNVAIATAICCSEFRRR